MTTVCHQAAGALFAWLIEVRGRDAALGLLRASEMDDAPKRTRTLIETAAGEPFERVVVDLRAWLSARTAG